MQALTLEKIPILIFNSWKLFAIIEYHCHIKQIL